MHVHQTDWLVDTRPNTTHEITDRVQTAVADSGVDGGLCTVFLHHTSASLILCENADPDVRADLADFMRGLVPESPHYRHGAEGADDMPAHLRTVLTQNSIGLPIRNGRCDLGTWQGVFIWEHRAASYQRKVSLTIVGQ